MEQMSWMKNIRERTGLEIQKLFRRAAKQGLISESGAVSKR